ncbi:hypothetical protein GOBAR_DD12749 [Gossypium barbadense]|nr:hypothetical protein GOBAR_DD12749 [Gossypium barbadense]
MAYVSDIKLIRTDTTLDLSQKAEKAAARLVALYLQDVGFRRCIVCKLLLKANGEQLGLYWQFSYGTNLFLPFLDAVEVGAGGLATF